VAVLSRQIDGQTNKIYDLEKILDDKKDVLRKTEDVLSREILSRSSLETKKLELLSEIANLKLKQAATERENSELRKKLDYVSKYPPEPSHVFAPSMFGTTPRRPRARSSNTSSSKTPSLPLETHFNYYHDEEDEEEDTATLRRHPPRRRSPSSHGGSVPNIAALCDRKTPNNTFKRNYSRASVEKSI
ncbi:PTPRF interacting protein_ binding protein 1 (Liprin beta 1), partial [Caligus rogercresseyi]